MNQIEKIIIHYIDDFESCELLYDSLTPTICFKLKNGSYQFRSLLRLLSPNSGFMQAVKRKQIPGAYSTLWKNHGTTLYLLPDEEKIKYLEENVIVD